MNKTVIALLIIAFFVVLGLAYYFPTWRLVIWLFPFIIGLNVFKNKKRRNTCITLFVIAWVLLFQYESARGFILNNLFPNASFTKTKFLFPPAGWIMFFNVDDAFGYTEIYGIKDNRSHLIDPHDIVRTRTIMYDNIHRNILSTVSRREQGKPFCQFLYRRFEHFDEFYVMAVYYPSLIKNPHERYQQLRYRCTE